MKNPEKNGRYLVKIRIHNSWEDTFKDKITVADFNTKGSWCTDYQPGNLDIEILEWMELPGWRE